MNDITLDNAFECCGFGFSVNYDGDNHKVLYSTNCNCCGEYFENKELSIYCGGQSGCLNYKKQGE